MSRPLKRITIVEDDLDIATLVTMTLEQFGGFEVTHFASATDALGNIPGNVPDLLLLDYSMPGMTGADLLVALRERPETKEIPAIFMTASVMPEHVQRLRDLGALQVFAKPFDPMSLVEKINDVWNRAFPF